MGEYLYMGEFNGSLQSTLKKKENLIGLLRHILKSAVRRMDALILFFSGHFIVDGSACVSSCPPGKRDKKKNGIKQCEPCIGLCPKGKVSI